MLCGAEERDRAVQEDRREAWGQGLRLSEDTQFCILSLLLSPIVLGAFMEVRPLRTQFLSPRPPVVLVRPLFKRSQVH